MNKTIFYFSILFFFACGNHSNTSEETEVHQEVKQSDPISESIREKAQSITPVLPQVQKAKTLISSWGIQTNAFSKGALICDFLKVRNVKQLSGPIRKSSCKNLDATGTLELSGALEFVKKNKKYKMLIHVFKKNVNTLKEIPEGVNKNPLNKYFKKVELHNKNVKAYFADDIIRVYLNNEQKVLISNYQLDERIREEPVNNIKEMIEVANLLLKNIK